MDFSRSKQINKQKQLLFLKSDKRDDPFIKNMDLIKNIPFPSTIKQSKYINKEIELLDNIFLNTYCKYCNKIQCLCWDNDENKLSDNENSIISNLDTDLSLSEEEHDEHLSD